ncbi:hypothetical protein [Streptomyces sp. C10-9-1]|uniref:hypothetical protein n=1 Tax=Streptomyces sp. C10-9-1 TaxID=1859285 RepID=UPI003D750F07
MADLTCEAPRSATSGHVPVGEGAVTEVRVEQAALDHGVVMAFARHGELLLMAYDPRDIAESAALVLLRERCALAGAVRVVHRTDV